MSIQIPGTRSSHPIPGRKQSNISGFACMCSASVLCLLAFLFAAALGIILGAFFSTPLLASIAAVIVGAAILLILIIALVIYRACLHCGRTNCE